MKKIVLVLSALLLVIMVTAQTKQTKPSTQAKPAKTTTVLIETEYGNITAVLYNDTPAHRDNFIKLVKQGWYNGSIFHRVINKFMIQGGQQGEKQDPGYTIPAEFIPTHFHKKGALAAARMGDQVNPTKASSGSQFYIVQGQVYTDEQLNAFEQKLGKKFSEDRRKAYTTVGGTPHLDDSYTVFGEVTKGLDVVDKIAAVQTAQGDRPVKDVKMKISIVK